MENPEIKLMKAIFGEDKEIKEKKDITMEDYNNLKEDYNNLYNENIELKEETRKLKCKMTKIEKKP